MGEIRPDEEVGELVGVGGNDVGRLLDELGERNDVGKMRRDDMVNKAGWFVTVTWARAELTKDAFVTAKTMMRAVRSVSKVGVEELD